MPDNRDERQLADRRAKLATADTWLAGEERRKQHRRTLLSARQAQWYARYHGVTES